jgi:hypothetical protein
MIIFRMHPYECASKKENKGELEMELMFRFLFLRILCELLSFFFFHLMGHPSTHNNYVIEMVITMYCYFLMYVHMIKIHFFLLYPRFCGFHCANP